MIIEGLAVAAFVKTCYSANKSSEMDEKALKKYAKAFEKNEEAQLLVNQKAEFTDKRLANVAKKKRAIVQTTVPRFIEVYSQIQKIELDTKTSVNEIALRNSVQKLNVLNSISISVKKEFTDKELVCGFITKGLGKLMEMDSERYLSAASSQVRASNVAYSQAESIGEAYDAICGRADRIAQLLMAMNALFIKSITETERVIKANGLNVRNYSDYDKGVLMTCVNVAEAMSDIIDVPVVDEKGQICQSGIGMIEIGEKYITKINNLL
ncbi:MAG: hypothetical protein RR071_10250 [Lachnospiraceae bacterium]